MTREPAIHLQHLLQCTERIAEYTRDGRDAFFAAPRTQDAVLRNLEVIGQVTRDLGVDYLTARAPGIPWPQVAGLRNVIAHQYLGVDLQLTWRIVERDLPALLEAARKLSLPPTSG